MMSQEPHNHEIPHSNALVPWQRNLMTIVASLIVCGYAWLAWSASSGQGGPTLDPVWADAQARKRLRVAVDVGFRPFVDQIDGRLTGYDVELTEAIAARLGLQAEFVPTGYDALYDVLVSRRADLVASALPYAPEQGFRARFSSVYFDGGQMLLVRDAETIRETRDLAGRRVGVALGSDADALARRLATSIPNLNLRSSYDEPAEAIADLRNARLDAVITDHVAALTAVQQAPGLQIAEALSSDPYVLAMPREAFQLEAEVNRALEALRAEGFLTTLNERWFR
jgi:ABC-type amino acid transport substrate-binding protein